MAGAAAITFSGPGPPASSQEKDEKGLVRKKGVRYTLLIKHLKAKDEELVASGHNGGWLESSVRTEEWQSHFLLNFSAACGGEKKRKR